MCLAKNHSKPNKKWLYDLTNPKLRDSICITEQTED